MSNPETPTVQSSQAEVWYLKQIAFRGKDLQIITQNFNGPCSFIAICNILILRGNILIEPPTRQTVSYEFLSQLVAEYLLMRSPNVDISAALSIMPHTQKGLDLNPLFTSSTSFLAETQTAGGELKLFSQAGIDLVHGWLVDPESAEARAMHEEKTEDYDSAVGLIAEADHVAGGLLVPGDEGAGAGSSSGSGSRKEDDWTDRDRRKIHNAITIRHFLEQTQSQLTYHGLFHLASTLPAGSLVALFRSSHLSVLYKSDDDGVQPAADGPRRSVDADGWEKGPAEWQVLDDSYASDAPIASGSGSKTQADPTPAPPAEASRSPTPHEHPAHPDTTPTQSADLVEVTTTPQTQVDEDHEGPISPPGAAPHPTPAAVDTKPAPASSIYTLVTDHVFLNEPSVVWERIEDVDGAAGVFVDSTFVLASPVGGDWAGHTADDTAADALDRQLAQQFQAEEEHYARRRTDAYLQQRVREGEERQQKELHAKRDKGRKGKDGKKKDCIIM